MSVLTVEDLLELGYYIREEIRLEFQNKHLTGNLANTVKVEQVGEDVKITIPAEAYDIKEYTEKGIIKIKPGESYAETVDEYGGFSKTHKNFAELCANRAIEKWLSAKQSKVKLVRKEETVNG